MDSTSSGAAGADVGCVVPQPSAITVKANIIETSTRDISPLLFHLFQTLGGLLIRQKWSSRGYGDCNRIGLIRTASYLIIGNAGIGNKSISVSNANIFGNSTRKKSISS